MEEEGGLGLVAEGAGLALQGGDALARLLLGAGGRGEGGEVGGEGLGGARTRGGFAQRDGWLTARLRQKTTRGDPMVAPCALPMIRCR